MTDPREPLRLERSELSNGLTLVRQPPVSGAGSCSVTYVGPAGWGFDPAGHEGTARLVNQLLTSATRRYRRVALARTLDRAGATLSHRCAPESGELTLWGPASEWTHLVDLLAEVVLHPRFDPRDLDRTRRQAHEHLLRESGQPANRAERELLHAVFPAGHPYSATGFGTSRSIDRIARSDLVRFHRTHYASGDACVVVTAPARLSTVEGAVRRAFHGFATDRPPPLRFPADRPAVPSERTVALPGRSQVEVRLGGRSIARDRPEYPAAFLANEVLGGRPLLSRLFQRVREKGGLAYHASSSLESMRFGGFWVAQAGSGPDRWRRVVPLLRSEVRRLSTTDVTDAELETIRESTVGEIPLALESTAEAHELAVDVAYHHLPTDYWERWPEALRAVRPRDVREAAALALDGRTAVTVVAGPVGRR